jgi:hypothetical protein
VGGGGAAVLGGGGAVVVGWAVVAGAGGAVVAGAVEGGTVADGAVPVMLGPAPTVIGASGSVTR